MYQTSTKKLNIIQDENPLNPRTEFDNLGVMICTHKRYTLGDEHSFDFDNYNRWDEAEKALKNEYDAAIIVPLFLYDHSGITISTSPFSCRWDSGQIGFILVSKETARKEYNVKRITKKILEKIKNCIKGEVETYNQYLTGDIYGFELIDNDGKVIDSCWGFYGSDIETNGILDCIYDDELKSLIKKKVK